MGQSNKEDLTRQTRSPIEPETHEKNRENVKDGISKTEIRNEEDRNGNGETEHKDDEYKEEDSEHLVDEGIEEDENESQGQAKHTSSMKRHKCTMPGCDASYARPSKLQRHLRGHTGERPFKCAHQGCDKAYTNSSHLKRHQEVHSLVKKRLECKVCFRVISNMHNLKRHYARVHGGTEKPHCKECNITFSKKRQLAEHEAMHAGFPMYKCDICAKRFAHATAYKIHVNYHQRQKSHTCSECSEVFHRWRDLRRHAKSTHSEYYKCKNCEKEFSSKTLLKKHSAVHSEDRQVLPCPYKDCHRFYHYQRNLNQHIRMKHEGKKYQCDMCKVEVTTKAVLIRHIKCVHELKRKKKVKKAQRNKRKDCGVPKRSMVSKLSGIELPLAMEEDLLRRKPIIDPDNTGNECASDESESKTLGTDFERVFVEAEDSQKVVESCNSK